MENPTDPSFRACRERLGLSQKVLARVLGVPRATLTRVEGGRRPMAGWLRRRINTLLPSFFLPLTVAPVINAGATVRVSLPAPPAPAHITPCAHACPAACPVLASLKTRQDELDQNLAELKALLQKLTEK